MSSDLDALRSLIREVIRDVLPKDLPVTETVNLSTDDDLATFVHRLLDLNPEQREELRSGRKRFILAAPTASTASVAPVVPAVPSAAPGPAAPGPAAPGPAAPGPAVRRIERGAVTEAVVRAAARAGERLVLGRGAVLTPLARDRARASGVQIEKES
jgi:hypothetical protein